MQSIRLSPPHDLFAEQGSLSCSFFQRGRTHFQTWVLGSMLGNMKDLSLTDLLGVMCEASLILYCGGVTSLLNLCPLLLLHDLSDLRQSHLQENAMWVPDIAMCSHSAS